MIKWLSNLRNLAWVFFDFCHPPRLYELRVDALCIIEILNIDIGLRDASMMVHAHTLRIRILIIYHWDLNWMSGLLIQVEGIALVVYLLIQMLQVERYLLLIVENVGRLIRLRRIYWISSTYILMICFLHFTFSRIKGNQYIIYFIC